MLLGHFHKRAGCCLLPLEFRQGARHGRISTQPRHGRLADGRPSACPQPGRWCGAAFARPLFPTVAIGLWLGAPTPRVPLQSAMLRSLESTPVRGRQRLERSSSPATVGTWLGGLPPYLAGHRHLLKHLVYNHLPSHSFQRILDVQYDPM